MKRIFLAVGMLGLVVSVNGASRSMSESKDSRERFAKNLQSMDLEARLTATGKMAGARRVGKFWAYASFDMSTTGRALAERLEREIQTTVNMTVAEQIEDVIVGCCVMRDNQLKPDTWRIQNIDDPLDFFPKIGSGDLLMVGCIGHGEVRIYYFLGEREAKVFGENKARNGHCFHDQTDLIKKIKDHAEQSDEQYVFSAEEEKLFETFPDSMRLILSLRLPGRQNQQAVSAVSSSSVSSRSASSISSQSSSSLAQTSLSASAQSASAVSSQNQVAVNQQQVEEVAKIAAAQRVQNEVEARVVSDVPRISVIPLRARHVVVEEENAPVPVQPQAELNRQENQAQLERAPQAQPALEQPQPQAEPQQPRVQPQAGLNRQENQAQLERVPQVQQLNQQEQLPQANPQQGKWGWKRKTALAVGAAVVIGSGAGVAALGVAGAKAAVVVGAAGAKAVVIKAGCFLAPHLMRQLGWMAVRPWWYLGL